jgi:hypothetical protein
MAKRAAQDIKNKTSRSSKTKKRLAIKKARLAALKTKRGGKYGKNKQK